MQNQADTYILHELTLEDISSITRVHMSAFPSSALTHLGRGAVRKYYDWLLRGPHDRVPLGAKCEGTLLGFCIGGRFKGALSGYLRRNLTYLLLAALRQPWLGRKFLEGNRLRIVLRSLTGRRGVKAVELPSLAPESLESFGILAIAVDPAYRRCGIGKMLMSEAERRACDLGFKRMHLSVHPSNTTAIEFYERLGWKRVTIDGNWNGIMHKPNLCTS